MNVRCLEAPTITLTRFTTRLGRIFKAQVTVAMYEFNIILRATYVKAR